MGLKPWVTFENAIQYTFIGFFGTIILAGMYSIFQIVEFFAELRLVVRIP
jgi:hypothetical protein